MAIFKIVEIHRNNLRSIHLFIKIRVHRFLAIDYKSKSGKKNKLCANEIALLALRVLHAEGYLRCQSKQCLPCRYRLERHHFTVEFIR